MQKKKKLRLDFRSASRKERVSKIRRGALKEVFRDFFLFNPFFISCEIMGPRLKMTLTA